MDIDLVIESENHLRLRNSLHSFLFDNKKDESLACYHYDCSLGKWLYTTGIFQYRHIPEVHSLERTHAELHNRLIDLANKDKKSGPDECRQIYHEIDELSVRLTLLIQSLREKIKMPAECAVKAFPGDEMDAGLVEHQALCDFFMQAPGIFCVLKGPSHVFQLINPDYKQLIGNREIKGKDIRTALPELEGQGVYELLDKVYEGKRTYTGREIPVYFDKGKGIPEKVYLNFIYKAIVNSNDETSGVLVFGYDVSEQVRMRKQSEESETRLKLAIDAAEIGSFEWNMNTREFICSENLAKIYGHKKKSRISYKEFTDAIHPDDKKLRIHAIEEALRTGIMFYEARITRPNGHIRWVKFSGRIVFDEKHNPRKMYGTALDVTDQKTLEERLEKKVKERTKELLLNNEQLIRQKELSESVINASMDNIAVLDTQLRFMIVNERALSAYKKKKEKIIGQSIRDVFPQVVKSGLYRDLKKALKGEGIHDFNYRSFILKGYFEVFIFPLRDTNDEVYSVLLITHDNTPVVEASERLIAANKKLEEKNIVLEKNNRELASFRYIANHDLQEPLRKIQIFSGLIRKNIHKQERVKEYIDNIVYNSKSMSDLVQAVLNYSRLSVNEQAFVKVNLDTVLKNVKKEFQPLINEKAATIKCSRLLSVKGDPGQLKQLFTCLMSNGLKFSDKKPSLTILSRVIFTDVRQLDDSKVDKYLELVFKDNGIGFEQKYADQVFRMFRRLQTSRQYPGAGIGLAIVKKIVENHGGHIFVKSEPMKGTAFYIYLPVL
ncbi:MAG: arcB [Bacteroidetes bacterium]|nr:arcB [Bacteroidota bacterium]